MGGKVSGKPQASKAKKSWKKPEGMPKRPLSAYNVFFAEERQRMLSGRRRSSPRNKLGFSGLAKQVAAKWRGLDEKSKAPFNEVAQRDKERYDREIEEWQDQGLDPRPPTSRRRKRSKATIEGSIHAEHHADHGSTTSPRQGSSREEEREAPTSEPRSIDVQGQRASSMQPFQEKKVKVESSAIAQFIAHHAKSNTDISHSQILSLALRSSAQAKPNYDPSNSLDQCTLWRKALAREVEVKQLRPAMLTNPKQITELARLLTPEEVEYIVDGFATE